MNNAEAGRRLLNGLADLHADVTAWEGDSTSESWRPGALRTILRNLAMYRSAVELALDAGSEPGLRQAACGASYLRKGVSDTGLFERPRDEALLARVQDVSTTADRICLSD